MNEMKFRHALDSDRVCEPVMARDGTPPKHVQDCMQRHGQISDHYADFFRAARPRGSAGRNTRTSTVTQLVVVAAEDPVEAVELTNHEECFARNVNYTGEYFTILITHADPQRTNAYVSYTANPFTDVYRYNVKQAQRLAQEPVAGDDYRVAVVIGPHICKHAAMDNGLSWVTLTRGAPKKLDKANWLSEVYNRPIYWSDQAAALTTEEEESEAEDLGALLSECADPLFAQLWHEEFLTCV